MRILIVLAAVGSLANPYDAIAQTTGTPACTNPETSSINATYKEGFELGMRIGAGTVADVQGAMTAYSQRYEKMKKSLSPMCGVALARLEQAMQQQQKRRKRPSQVPSILYDKPSDTYHAPGLASCGPSGCTLH